MSYQLLSKLYFQDKEKYLALYESRFNSESTVKLPLEINKSQAFFLINSDILALIEALHKQTNLLCLTMNKLSEIALTSLIRDCVISEILLTNKIEGVRSTREELQITIDEKSDTQKKRRFSGLVKHYQKLMSSVEIETPIANCSDLRTLYNELVLPEIEEENKPDGSIFRKETAVVMSPTQKELHRGLYPEDQLADFLKCALDFLHNDEISSLIRIALFHYLFGYAHPFYDGNGRTSRFISSYLLQKELHPVVSLRLSHTIYNNKNRYYKAFELCNNAKNKGDLTPFLYAFFEILKDCSSEMIQKANGGLAEITHYAALSKRVVENVAQLKKPAPTMLQNLIEHSIFSEQELPIEEIAGQANCSITTARTTLQVLVDHKIPIIVSKSGHRKLYHLDLEAFEAVAESILS